MTNRFSFAAQKIALELEGISDEEKKKAILMALIGVNCGGLLVDEEPHCDTPGIPTPPWD